MSEQTYTFEDYFEEGLMRLNGCCGFALEIGDSLTKLAYIEPAPEEPREAGWSPYRVNYRIKLLTFTVLENALAYMKEHVTKGLDLNYPKTLKLGTGPGFAKHKEKIETALGLKLEEESDSVSPGQGLFYGVTKLGKAFFKDVVYSPAKDKVAGDLDKFKSDVARFQTEMDNEKVEDQPDPEDCEAVWKLEEKNLKKYLPSLVVSMDESKCTLVMGENMYEDIPVEKTSQAKETVTQALRVAREKKVVVGVFFHGEFCRDNRQAMVEALKGLPIQDMKNTGGALVAGVVRHPSYLKIIGTLMEKVHFMRLLMICPCGPPAEYCEEPLVCSSP
ncbi:uncharacterized protein LOC135494862 [Lineus longissimus]|uniref:uncharacterized protein LOC135494862 n=1 Tax=Lineus longissimus TaxID=88925 RepID=UPI002B4CCA81